MNLEQQEFYVYVYLDPRKPGDYNYGEYHFDYEPFYVGKGKDKRMYHQLKGNRYNKHIVNKIKIIRKENMEPIIIKYLETLFEMTALEFERKMIICIGRDDLKLGPLCNLTNGGDGLSGYRHSEKTKNKLCEKSKGNKNRLGKHHTEETKQKLREKLSGRTVIFTNEHRKNLSLSQIGKKRPEVSLRNKLYPLFGEKNGMYGKHHTEETKRKIKETKYLKLLEKKKNV